MGAPGKVALVTGVAGFTGRYVRSELQAHGWRVVGIGSHSAEEPSKNYHQVDLLDAAGLNDVLALIRPDAVVHLAALAFVAHGNVDDFYKVNLIGTRNLLSAIAASGNVPQCVLLASSANVYGNAASGMLDEDTRAEPANDYAVSKLAMEYMASLWKDRLPLVVARPFNYTGVGQAGNFLIPKIVDHFKRRDDVIELGNLDVWREFNDVRMVAQIYRRLIETPAAIGNTYNVCTGKQYSLREVVALCEEITGHRIELKVNPAFVRTGEVRELKGNPSRLERLFERLGEVDLDETLRWMLCGQG
ncbi:GDP-mannose 4,6-dehydratase [Pseudoxanthomonas sp. X-1]|uniref:GDP-mannose 4,6-dehydratase n=1 Tax=Pseudoxanthomonas sp. X-1 TaxID=2571115 RepID=UPI00110BE877|nr:GDP-mannose 4,6-dehydratase [Pseudoxanthomonas sp. X-1]TMN19314.1 NAD-dependent epimerase/dehydratase family protein [Pseudoxanthomonas sp. X-1]UAY74172.1 GDP-mannose 4,6-dehydratase [Pseudoxanthomonas sp. X-1]